MKNLKITIILITSILLFFITSNTTQAQTTNFTGTWSLNEAKTDLGGGPVSALPTKFQITQGSDAIEFKRFVSNDAGEETSYIEKLKNDKTISEVLTSNGFKRKAFLAWSDDKKNFIVSSQSFDKDGEPYVKIRETWVLADGGKALIVTREVEQVNGVEYTSKVFYDKK